MDESTIPRQPKDKDGKYPYIRPEELKSPQRLAVDAEDVEDFIEHFTHHDDHEHAHSVERDAKIADASKKSDQGTAKNAD